jgi:PEP-CTERM motif
LTIRPLPPFLFACFALGCAAFAHADIPATLTFDASNQAAFPDTTDYEGNFYDGSSAPYNITIGTFSFTIPTGDYVTGGTISGTFGDQNIGVTALTDLFVNNGSIAVGACDDFTAPCALGTSDGSLVPWSYTFNATDLSNLASDFSAGSLDFTAVQNSFGSVIVGTPVLDFQVAPVPEPASILTFGSSLLFLAFLVFRRRK